LQREIPSLKSLWGKNIKNDFPSYMGLIFMVFIMIFSFIIPS